MNTSEIKPFPNCEALDVCHCQSSSLARIFYNNRHPLSEEMLLGLGAGQGFYAPITFAQLEKARNSPYKPFPPKNTWLEFDFSNFHPPRPEDLYTAIRQTLNDMLDPPISNIGIKGIRRTGKDTNCRRKTQRNCQPGRTRISKTFKGHPK